MSFDNMLDATLDDLNDLPEYAVLPAGAHQCLASFEEKEVNGKACVELRLKLIQHLELANPTTDKPLEPGAECSMLFMLDNEYGQGNFKKLAKPFAAAMGLSSLRDIVEQVKNIEVAAVTSLRADKNDKDKFYLNVKELECA